MATSVAHLPGKAYPVTVLLDAYEAAYRPPKVSPPAERTLNDLLTAYRRDHLPRKAPRTQYTEGLLFDWIAREMGSIPLAQLTPLVLRSWRDSLANAAYKPNTIRRYLTAFSAVLTAGVTHYRWLAQHPLQGHMLTPPKPRGRDRCLEADELPRLLAACQASSNQWLFLAVSLALSTGARKNELLQRKWGDVDLERGLLSIPQSKNGDRRALILIPPVVTLLENYARISRSAWVFPRADGRQPVLLEYAWREACGKAGLTDLRFHDLRHTTASYLARSGASLREIAEILGHRSLEQTMKYMHLIEPHTRAVVQHMVDTFLPLPTPVTVTTEEG